jgi:hypothetical protein
MVIMKRAGVAHSSFFSFFGACYINVIIQVIEFTESAEQIPRVKEKADMWSLSSEYNGIEPVSKLVMETHSKPTFNGLATRPTNQQTPLKPSQTELHTLSTYTRLSAHHHIV